MTAASLPRPRNQGHASLTVADLDGALDDNLLVAYYQPVVDLRTGLVVAAEALARLRHPHSCALLEPAEFIPLAERTGRVGRIDDLVAHAAIGQAAAWRAALPADRPFSVGVNVSAAHLWDRQLPARLCARSSEVGLPLNALIVELTETVLSERDAGHEDVLMELAALGLNVTMDDFCTGYSSLSHLHRFPVHGVKVDRAFVSSLGTARGDHITSCLIRFGLDLGVHVVAEGIETVHQLGVLQAAGCPFGQGYLFGRPVPAVDFADHLYRVFNVSSAANL